VAECFGSSVRVPAISSESPSSDAARASEMANERTIGYRSFASFALACFKRVGVFPGGKEVFVGSQQPSIRIAKLPFRYRWTVGCQLNLVAVAPFVPLLLSSAQHIRAPVVEENLRNSPAANGSSY